MALRADRKVPIVGWVEERTPTICCCWIEKRTYETGSFTPE